MLKQAIHVRLIIYQMPLRLVCTCSDATVRLLSPGSGECITTMLLPSMSIIADVAYAAAESTWEKKLGTIRQWNLFSDLSHAFSSPETKKQINFPIRITPNLVNMQTFIRICCKLMNLWDPKVAYFHKGILAKGATWYTFLCKKFL